MKVLHTEFLFISDHDVQKSVTKETCRDVMKMSFRELEMAVSVGFALQA